MKGINKIGIFILALFLITACSNNENNVPEGNQGALFNLTIKNGTNSEVEIFLKDSSPNSGFDSEGNIAANGMITIKNLVVDQTYVVRASMAGEPAADFFYEETILRNSPTDLTLTVSP